MGLVGKKIVITAGPTQEHIDLVCYVSNESSGKMGYQIARAFAARNARVILVSGPTQLSQPDKIEKFIRVKSAAQMHAAVMEEINEADIFIGVAAVADYTPIAPSTEKIKKTSEIFELKLKRTTDILASVAEYRAKNKRSMMVVGFAAETNNLAAYAMSKLMRKNVDMICANLVGENKAFGTDTNEIIVFKRNNQIVKVPLKTKNAIADELADIISRDYSRLCDQLNPLYGKIENSDESLPSTSQ